MGVSVYDVMGWYNVKGVIETLPIPEERIRYAVLLASNRPAPLFKVKSHPVISVAKYWDPPPSY